ncbi:MAG: hypothetical protein ACUVWO_10200 [Thermodesulfobacteriota bacterium]
MPLEFQSISHGKIAFGFFNIETDMILLNETFLFGEDFCRYIVQFAESEGDAYEAPWEVYLIPNRMDMGNLMGAIHGFDDRGFIGEVYTLFPFPAKKEAFKQNPEGFQNRPVIEKVIQRYARRINISFLVDQTNGTISIGQYVFSKTVFQELIQYLWMGGFPRWKDDIRPHYIMAMKRKIEQSKHPFLKGLTFE